MGRCRTGLGGLRARRPHVCLSVAQQETSTDHLPGLASSYARGGISARSAFFPGVARRGMIPASRGVCGVASLQRRSDEGSQSHRTGGGTRCADSRTLWYNRACSQPTEMAVRLRSHIPWWNLGSRRSAPWPCRVARMATEGPGIAVRIPGTGLG